MLIQQSLVWLAPSAALARSLVSDAGIPEHLIDFSEPVWPRMKRIMDEARRREMMPQLLAAITAWYPENTALAEAKALWEIGQDRRAAAQALRKEARNIRLSKPTAAVKVTKDDDGTVTDVDVDVDMDAEIADKAKKDAPSKREEPSENFVYSDDLTPGDLYSLRQTLIDHEKRLSELEAWRTQLSIMPTPNRKP